MQGQAEATCACAGASGGDGAVGGSIEHGVGCHETRLLLGRAIKELYQSSGLDRPPSTAPGPLLRSGPTVVSRDLVLGRDTHTKRLLPLKATSRQ